MSKFMKWKKIVVVALAGLWLVTPVLVFAESATSETSAVGSTQTMGTGATMEAGKSYLDSEVKKWMAVAAGICIAIAAFGGALAQSKAVAAALTGIARNPGAQGKIFVPMILGLVLIESLVIYALVIAYMLANKV